MKHYLVRHKDVKHLVRLHDHGYYSRGEEWIKKYINHVTDAWVKTELARKATDGNKKYSLREINTNQAEFYKAIL